MLLTLYLSLMSVAFVCIILGYYFKDVAVKGIGFLLMALISLPLLNGQLQYKTADNITKLTASNTYVSYIYSTYDAHYFGIIFFILGVVGSTYQVFDEWTIRKNRRYADED